ncbi:MAG: hypothetical protein PHU91_06390 [Candidatus Omnitrophica bacterium]|nr:hypothetical protein [Candidatus Omnitrophota bacterium]MDD5237268.1 hypothetical protein [Candidatus Omnitrophota bacterium]MDD5611386.1 hypothetical protein [Candidatus Omnitrophota bacterium]
MKRLFILSLCIALAAGLGYAQGQPDKPKAKILLLISEQNIQGPALNWWAGESGSSAMETNLAKLLKDLGFQIIDPSLVHNIAKKERASRVVNLGNKEALHLGQIARADYLVLGKATASCGSSMAGQDVRPCYANATAKLIRTKDGVVIANLDAIGSSANIDVVAAGKEALSNSAVDLAAKIISNLTKEGGK